MPKPSINDNYVIWDSVKNDETNRILNPINSEQYMTLINEIEADGLERAKEKGIMESAETNMKRVISSFLDQFKRYSVEYM